MIKNEKDLITIKQAADLKGITPQLMRYYINEKLSPDPIIIAGKKFFYRQSVLKWEIA